MTSVYDITQSIYDAANSAARVSLISNGVSVGEVRWGQSYVVAYTGLSTGSWTQAFGAGSSTNQSGAVGSGTRHIEFFNGTDTILRISFDAGSNTHRRLPAGGTSSLDLRQLGIENTAAIHLALTGTPAATQGNVLINIIL